MIIEAALLLFLAYILGRIGDYFAGHWNFFHHWVYGMLIMIMSAFAKDNSYMLYLFSFGLGLIISDFEDMINSRVYGPDKKKTKKFWGFD